MQKMKYMSKKVHSPKLNNHLISYYICCDLSRKIQVRLKFFFWLVFSTKSNKSAGRYYCAFKFIHCVQ